MLASASGGKEEPSPVAGACECRPRGDDEGGDEDSAHPSSASAAAASGGIRAEALQPPKKRTGRGGVEVLGPTQQGSSNPASPPSPEPLPLGAPPGTNGQRQRGEGELPKDAAPESGKKATDAAAAAQSEGKGKRKRTREARTTQSVCACGASKPVFGLKDGLRQWCKKCPTRPPKAVDLVHKKLCECGKRASYGAAGDPPSAARWCYSCPGKPETAVNLVTARCECGRMVAMFGLPGGKRRWCSQCPGISRRAVDVVHKRCECGRTRATIRPPDAKVRRWCKHCPGYLHMRETKV